MKKLIVLISVFLLLSAIHTNEIKVNASGRIKLPASITFENVQKINTQPVPVMLEKIEEIQDIKIKSPPPVQPNIKD